jgi:uncharacterized protein DUF4136
MRYPIRIAVASIMLGTMPALASAQEVTYDFNRSRNFAHVNSFVIKSEIGSDNPLVDQRIVASIASTLSARGLRQVESDPDVIVVPKMTVEMRKEVTAYNSGYWPGYGWGSWYGGWGWGGWGGWGATTFESRDRQYNTLVIDMVDAKTGDLLWRGSGVKRIHAHWKPHEIDKKVQKTVAKILSNYPPASSYARR